jgi:hypothetical protein
LLLPDQKQTDAKPETSNEAIAIIRQEVMVTKPRVGVIERIRNG